MDVEREEFQLHTASLCTIVFATQLCEQLFTNCYSLPLRTSRSFEKHWLTGLAFLMCVFYYPARLAVCCLAFSRGCVFISADFAFPFDFQITEGLTFHLGRLRRCANTVKGSELGLIFLMNIISM